MEIKNNPKELLINILKKYNTEDKVLFQLRYKYMLHVDLSRKYQYLEDWSLNKDYVKECTEKAIEVFNFMKFSHNLLIVYDDIYISHGTREKEFVEGTLKNIIQYDNYKLDWKFPEDDNIYTCNRRIYQVEKVDIEKLFKEIVISDIGGELDLTSSTFIIDMDTGCIFYLYDDRGLYLFAPKEDYLIDVWKEFYDDVFVDCKGFKIAVKKLYWIDGKDDAPEDLCLHGDVVVTIGEEIIHNSCTVSAAALRILRTLSRDHLPTIGEQMLPCCGHTMIANETLDEVEIIGCDDGIDWTVIHENGMVKIITENENTVYIYYLQYKEEVLRFVYMVEDYYKKSSNKVLPEDEFERDGYIAFWNEWNRRICDEQRI